MKLYPENIYHIYNRGNNKQKIFFTRDNYIFFLQKVRRFLKSNVDFIAYCLMPNHFHFLIVTPLNFNSTSFGDELKIMLSSYSKAINNQEKRTGSLFQQNSKSKCLTFEAKKNSLDYGLICFNYIHQNPVMAGLVKKIEDWEFSSFRDYIGLRNGSICNKELTRKLLNLPSNEIELYNLSYAKIKHKFIESVF